MATPDDQARAMSLLANRWRCHAEGRLEDLDRHQLESHAERWRRWQECLTKVSQVIKEFRRA